MKELWRLLKLFSPYKFWLIGGVFVSLASMLANIALMGVSGWFIAAMGLAGVTGAAINYFTPASIIRACAIIRTGGRYCDRLLTHEATFRIIAVLRRWFYDHLEPLAPAILSKERSGDVLSKLMGDIDTLERFYLGFIVPAAVAFLASIIIVAFLYLYDPLLALIVGGLLAFVGGVIPVALFMLGRDVEEDIVDATGEMRAELASNLQGLGELLVYDGADQYKDKSEQIFESNQLKQDSLNIIKVIGQNIGILCANIAMVCALVIASKLSSQGQIGAPDIAMLTLFVLASFEAVMPVSNAMLSLGGVIRAAKRIFEITDKKPAITDPQEAMSISKDFSLSFKDVSFAYDAGSNKPVLDKMSFALKAGEKMMVVGPTGAGKSSLVNLILRFWEPQGGSVMLGGKEISCYRSDDLLKSFSVVPQNPYLFETTIRNNLLVAKADASEEEMHHVCEKAGLAEFISSLPKGLDTYVGQSGRQLSGGQVKRVALARALLKQAPCIIMDEPGEGLDYEMEREIMSRVIASLDGAALVYITHRKCVAEQMDKVLEIRA